MVSSPLFFLSAILNSMSQSASVIPPALVSAA